MATAEAVMAPGLDSQHGESAVNSSVGWPWVGSVPTEWVDILHQCGAALDEFGVAEFGQAPVALSQALVADVMSDLSHFGLIEVSGLEAQKFLSSLFTGDVRLVSASQGQFTSWCDGKGRIQATFWLFMRGGAYYLLLPMERLQPILARMKQFLLRTKATIKDASGLLVRVGLSGPGLQSRLEQLMSVQPPVGRGETADFGDCSVVALGGGPHPRWLLVGPPAAVTSVWSELLPGSVAVGREVWSLLDILAGIPQVVTATADEFIPQMLDLEALGGLSFTKGCYPGQEVIARLHYRGQLKRRAYLAYMETGSLPRPGTKLYGDATSESVGMVVAAARHPSGKIAVLAVVVIEQKALGEVHLADQQGPVLEFTEPAHS